MILQWSIVMNGYVTASELAKKWGITERQVQSLCKSGKIEGATKFGPAWAIPEGAVKPTRTGTLKPGRKPKYCEDDTYGITK